MFSNLQTAAKWPIPQTTSNSGLFGVLPAQAPFSIAPPNLQQTTAAPGSGFTFGQISNAPNIFNQAPNLFGLGSSGSASTTHTSIFPSLATAPSTKTNMFGGVSTIFGADAKTDTSVTVAAIATAFPSAPKTLSFNFGSSGTGLFGTPATVMGSTTAPLGSTPGFLSFGASPFSASTTSATFGTITPTPSLAGPPILQAPQTQQLTPTPTFNTTAPPVSATGFSFASVVPTTQTTLLPASVPQKNNSTLGGLSFGGFTKPAPTFFAPIKPALPVATQPPFAPNVAKIAPISLGTVPAFPTFPIPIAQTKTSLLPSMAPTASTAASQPFSMPTSTTVTLPSTASSLFSSQPPAVATTTTLPPPYSAPPSGQFHFLATKPAISQPPATAAPVLAIPPFDPVTTLVGATPVLPSPSFPTTVSTAPVSTVSDTLVPPKTTLASSVTTSVRFDLPPPSKFQPPGSTGASAFSAPTIPTNLGVAFAPKQTTSSLPTPGIQPVPPSFSSSVLVSQSKPAVTSIGTTSITASTPASVSSQAAQPVTPAVMNYRQLGESVINWKVELEEMEKTFLDQAAQINVWEEVVRSNGEKLNKLTADIECSKLDEDRIGQQLEFLVSQQEEMNTILTTLENQSAPLDQASKSFLGGGFMNADAEREETFVMAETIDFQLYNMERTLKDLVEEFNGLETRDNGSGDHVDGNADSLQQITQILNTHMDLLKWIETNTEALKGKLQDMSYLGFAG